MLVIVAGLSFAVRLGEVVSKAAALSGSALAQEEVDAAPPALNSSGGQAAQNNASKGQEVKQENQSRPREYETVEWKDATGSDDMDESGTSMKLYEDLSKRRKEIEKRERELIAREALLKATEQELDQKYRELQILRGELEALLQKQSAEEEARIKSLVKIYEGMKSDDAARIFNSLDIDVLVEVMSRMSERKLSPILADMNPDRAQAITILLAQQKQLPELSH